MLVRGEWEAFFENKNSGHNAQQTKMICTHKRNLAIKMNPNHTETKAEDW